MKARLTLVAILSVIIVSFTLLLAIIDQGELMAAVINLAGSWHAVVGAISLVTLLSACDVAVTELKLAYLSRVVSTRNVVSVGGDCMVSGAIYENKLRHVDGGSPKPSHVERMHQEQEQLAERTRKLEEFIALTPMEALKQLSQSERNRMKRQLVAMREYLAVLNERIAAATNP
ncbi:crAss001_48 related protein [Aeromonas veronii]